LNDLEMKNKCEQLDWNWRILFKEKRWSCKM